MTTLLTEMARHWWVLVLRGILAILFGLTAFVWPGLTIAVLVMVFGIYALFDGVATAVFAIGRRREDERWWVWLLDGLVGIGFGLLALFAPEQVALALLIVIGFWAIAGGAFRIVAAIRLRQQIEGEWLLALGGVLSILFGLLLLVMPAAGVLSFAWLIGFYAILFGIVMVALGLRLRKFRP